ncbi:hypothetical protein B0F90DRAFT_1925123 [Multifurca ochricompacta]|uniref:Uncharacterized protein n=1 Tax=Multifurca ochricompacta TaxID=376703 RepID=A0AAD4M527_9AGAM|nr:hypothetical protein B0F90DRAFT_1925123 [Multifurca ochricompacta]
MKDVWNIQSYSVSPHSTPTTKPASTRASLRPPIFNPYDRFTQPEFDTWIGDITTALRRALHHEAEPEIRSSSRHSIDLKTIPDGIGGSYITERQTQQPASTEAHGDESYFEDSFAQIASRKAKGKARDPREGPGLGLKDQPIELLTDSEEEEVIDSIEEDAVLLENPVDSAREGSSSESGYASSDSDEREETDPAQPGTSIHHAFSFLSSEDSVHDQEVAESSDVNTCDIGDEEDMQFLEDANVLHEDEVDGSEGFSTQEGRDSKVDPEDDFPIPSQSEASFDVELEDPWDGPRTFAEDYYSGGDHLAPGLTPNHLTPAPHSPAPLLTPNLPIVSATGKVENRPSTSPNVLSASLSPNRQGSMDSDEIKESPQRGIASALSVNSQQSVVEVATKSYYDHVEVADITMRAVGITECEVIEGTKDVDVLEARPRRKENPTPYPKRFDLGTVGQNPNQEHDIICDSPSDDEHTDADGEEEGGTFLGIIPLGTSDLEVGDDWGSAHERMDASDTSAEEDELQDVVPSQGMDDITEIEGSQSLLAVNDDGLNSSKAAQADLPTPRIAPSFHLTDADNFGDLPVSSPPSETPSPAPDGHTEAYKFQQHSIDRLFADLERQVFEEHSQASKPSALLTRESESESAKTWASQELESILSGDLIAADNETPVSKIALREEVASQETPYSAHHLGYVVEESKLEADILLPSDDIDDAHSIPPLDLEEVVETIQQYEVEEPKADRRFSEELDTMAEAASSEDSSVVPQSIISSPDRIATSTVLKLVAYSAPATGGQSHSSGASPRGASQTDFAMAVPTIPAPIVADPSVPDPVPGDSYPTSPAIIDSYDDSSLSIVPLSVLKAFNLDASPMNSETSGLFTPAQRSDGGTPALLEDETIEAMSMLDNNGSRGIMTTPGLQSTGDASSSVERSIVVEGDGGRAEIGGPMRADNQNLAISAAETGDDIASMPRGRSAEPASSQSPPLTGTIPGILLKDTSERLDVLAASGERSQGTPSIMESDEDADGEADPDYSPIEGDAEVIDLNGARQPVWEGEATLSKVGKGTSTAESTPKPEIPPTSISVQKEELLIVGPEASGLPDSTSATTQDRSPCGGGDAKDMEELPTSAQSYANPNNVGELPTQALKRKRTDPISRSTRSKSGVSGKRVAKKARISSSRETATSKEAGSERVDAGVDGDSADDGASESASVSSSASAVYRLLRPLSRAGSVVSSGSGDVSWGSPTSGLSRMMPLVHPHGLLHHHHGWPAPPPPPPPLALSTPFASPRKASRSEKAKTKSPTSFSEPSTPSLKSTLSVNTPVTRSNCRFHKISLPRGDNGLRAYFVVPGCALGDGELMEREDIKDEGFSTHEDHKRMLPNVETLDLNQYLVGVLRKLVGVDLLREQQEIFYLPSEEERPRKRRQAGAVESLRQLQRQSISSRGPLAREHSPWPLEALQVHATPPRSASGSVASVSVQEGSATHTGDGDSVLSDLNDGDDLNKETPAKRPKSSAVMGPPLVKASVDGPFDISAAPEHTGLAGKDPLKSNQPRVTRRSKRRGLGFDAVAYKPSEDENEDEEVEETRRKRSTTRKATKRSRTMEETTANPPRSKRTRLSRSVSVADGGAVDC